jgi:Uma2 family endonuclease
MPTIATMSGAQFDALPYEEGRRWELLEGELIEVLSPTPRHQIIVKVLLLKIEIYLEGRREHCLVMPDVEFALSGNVRLRPDVCVLLPDKAIQLDLDRIPIPGAPDLAIEMISPTERTAESRAKVEAYLRYGVAEVWQIYPKSRVLEIYKGENGHRTLSADQQITTDLLPGFSVTLSSLFE